MQYSVKDHAARLWMDPIDLSRMSQEAVTGCLVHELCHIERDWRRGKVGAWFFDPLYWSVPAILSWEERRVDLLAVRKGYGEHLLALHAYHDQHYAGYDNKDGLTVDEIRKQKIKRSKKAS